MNGFFKTSDGAVGINFQGGEKYLMITSGGGFKYGNNNASTTMDDQPITRQEAASLARDLAGVSPEGGCLYMIADLFERL